jgi:hypothetical protein
VVEDDAVLVAGHVLAEEPHRALVVLRIPVACDLVDAPAHERHELRDQHLGRLAVHLDLLVLGQERDLDLERIAFIVAQVDGRVLVADREQRVSDGGRIGERGRVEVDALAPRDGRERHRGNLLDRRRRRARGPRTRPTGIAARRRHQRPRQAASDQDRPRTARPPDPVSTVTSLVVHVIHLALGLQQRPPGLGATAGSHDGTGHHPGTMPVDR